jgi:hypothetical protein
MSNQPKTAKSCRLALKAEQFVLSQYIQTLGLTEDPAFVVSCFSPWFLNFVSGIFGLGIFWEKCYALRFLACLGQIFSSF